MHIGHEVTPQATALVIGGGFSGLSAACYLQKKGYQVTLLEKNESVGGRARAWHQDGFRFDMGPSWYWMPDVIEEFFQDFGCSTSDFYKLDRLDPSYRVFFGKDSADKDDYWDIPASLEGVSCLFESVEPGAADALKKFLKDAQIKYQAGMYDYARRPSLRVTEFFDIRMAIQAVRLNLFGSYGKHVRRYFSHPRIRQILEFPVLFLGATAEKTPAMYSMMSYADLCLGTWYPQGGMNRIICGMQSVATRLGVQIRTEAEVGEVLLDSSGGSSKAHVAGVSLSSGEVLHASLVVAGADYHHVESKLLPVECRSYSEDYWDKREFAPSCMLYYIGVNTRLNGLQHHNLFFDGDFDLHAKELYEDKRWPTKPHSYVCVPSKTDPSVAPEGSENLFILIPVAAGLEESDEVRDKYLNYALDKISSVSKVDVRKHIEVKRAYSRKNFVEDYHACKGNAYGLANTLKQTAIFKPKMKSSKVEGLYFVGQLTVPGPGVPPALLSGKMVSGLVDSPESTGRSMDLRASNS